MSKQLKSIIELFKQYNPHFKEMDDEVILLYCVGFTMGANDRKGQSK
jgi:hypothetical protein